LASLRKRTLNGIIWSSSAQIIKQLLQFVISIILARLLTPEDFGLVGMVVVFTGFAGLFSELGFGAALIQNHEVEEPHYSSVFWLSLVAGLVITGLVIVAAPFIAAFYSEPMLIPLTMLIAVNFSISPFRMVQEAIYSRTMAFRYIAIIEITSVAISSFVAIILAVQGFGVWCLVWQMLIASSVQALAFWNVSRWRPKMLFDRAAVLELLGFSSSLVGYRTINYWVRNSDNLLVGKAFGTASLGIYARAYSIMLLPVSQVTHTLSRVMFPALSTVKDDKVRAKRIYLRSVATIALLTFPMMLGLFVVADDFVLALYGLEWRAVIPPLRIFCLLGLVQSIGATVGWIYQSQGRTDLMLKWSLGAGVLLICSFVVGVIGGTIVTVAAAYTFTGGVLLLYPLFAIPGKLIGMTFGDVVHSVAGVLSCAAVMAFVVWCIGLLLPANWPHWAFLSVQIPAGIAAYTVLLNLFNIRAYREAKESVLEHFGHLALYSGSGELR
jgi:PST family polysaccharide transporter